MAILYYKNIIFYNKNTCASRSNKRAQLTYHIVELWLTAFHVKTKQQNSHILLFSDNATCHPRTELPIVWFQPNTTSISEPMHQKVIKSIKMNYHKLLTWSLLASMVAVSSATETVKFTSVLAAVIWVAEITKQVPHKQYRIGVFRNQDLLLVI
jgi:hypothetical protein